MYDSDPVTLMEHMIDKLNSKNIGYLHVVEIGSFDHEAETKKKGYPIRNFNGTIRRTLKHKFKGTWITNTGMTFDLGNKSLIDNEADLIAFGSLFVANDNLVDKFKSGVRLNDI